VEGKGHFSGQTERFESDGQLRKPDKKLLGCGFSTPYTLFCLICTNSSELNHFLIFTHLSEPGLISAV